MYINRELVKIFSSPVHKVLRVTYCDRPYSASVRCPSTVLPRHLLLWKSSLDLVKNRFLKCNFQNISCPNYNAQRFHIWYITSSSSPLPGLLNYTPRVYRDSLGGWSALRGYIQCRKSLNILSHSKPQRCIALIFGV